MDNKSRYKRKIGLRTFYVALYQRTELIILLYLLLIVVSFLLSRFWLYSSPIGMTGSFILLAFISLILSFFFGFAYQIIVDRVFDKKDIEEMGIVSFEIKSSGKQRRKDDMKNPFKEKTRYEMIQNLLHIDKNMDLLDKVTDLIDDVQIDNKRKIITVLSLGEDALSSSFSKGLSDAFVLNGSSAIVCDLNLQKPFLAKQLAQEITNDDTAFLYSPTGLKPNIDLPLAQVGGERSFVGEPIESFVRSSADNYEHIICILPAFSACDDASLSFAASADLCLLVVQRDVTKKKELYEAIDALHSHDANLLRVVILK